MNGYLLYEIRAGYQLWGHAPSERGDFWKRIGNIDDLLALFQRAVNELAYIQEAPTKELCQTSEGCAIIAEAKKLLERIP